MKKIVVMFLIFSQANGALGSELFCRDLFAGRLDSQNLNQNSDSLKDQLDANETLIFKKPAGFISGLKQKLGWGDPAPVEFNLRRFREKTEFYKTKLANSVSVEGALVPKNIEEALALIEAKNQLNPVASLIDAVPRWLASATAKNVEKMTKLLNFKSDRGPVAPYSQMAKIYLLAHARPESFSEILNRDLDEKAEKIIVERASISFLTKNFESAMAELNIDKPRGIKAFIYGAHEKYPNASTYAINLAIGAVEIAQFGMPIFATIREFNLTKAPVAKLTDEQRLQIINGDFHDLDPKLQKRLLRIAKSELVWKRFLKIVGLAGFVYMIYYIQERLRHDWFSTLNKVDRERLETEVLGVYVSALIVRHEPLPSAAEIAQQKIDIRNASDEDLQQTIRANWHLVDQAHDILKNHPEELRASVSASVGSSSVGSASVGSASVPSQDDDDN